MIRMTLLAPFESKGEPRLLADILEVLLQVDLEIPVGVGEHGVRGRLVGLPILLDLDFAVVDDVAGYDGDVVHLPARLDLALLHVLRRQRADPERRRRIAAVPGELTRERRQRDREILCVEGRPYQRNLLVRETKVFLYRVPHALTH